MFKKNVGLGFSSTGKNAKDAKEYIISLIDSGANEFFTGYNPPYWYEKFGFEVSPNMRFAEHEQISDFETLKIIVEEIHKKDLNIYANLNFWYYTDETFPLIKRIILDFISIGIDGMTCASIGILEYLREIDYKGKINISTIMPMYNKESIRFILNNYRVNKIILSREQTLKEMESIVKDFPDVNFEFFGEGDFCRYNNGYCFAEHKYSNKDICTIVQDELVIKRKYKPNFKEIVLDEHLSNEEKTNLLDATYRNIFEEIEDIFLQLELPTTDKETLKSRLKELITIGINRVDLYYDAVLPYNSKRNRNIVTFLKTLRYLDIEKNIQKELEDSIKSGIEFGANKIKEYMGESRLKADTLKKLYARSDNLNLYSYLFLSKFQNMDTKFPTRGRNNKERLEIISNVIKEGIIDKKYLDRGISMERTHYDLTYLFGEKLWFRNLVKEYY